jgi:transposase
MDIRLTLHPKTREKLLRQCHQAYAAGDLRLGKRIEAILNYAEGDTYAEIGVHLHLSEPSVRNYVQAYLAVKEASFVYRRAAGRPAKLTQTQKKELVDWVVKGPEAAGYDCGCWSTGLIQDLIYQRFGVAYSVYYVAELLKNLGLSYQKARFISDHLDDVAPAQEDWKRRKWPEIRRLAKAKRALIIFLDEVSFAQWGSLSYTWGVRGQQPVVKTSGKRKAYKVLGGIEYFSGRFFHRGQTGKFNSQSYQAFLKEILRKTKGHYVIFIQDGASYHTCPATQHFFAQYADRVSVFDLPKYSPKFNPIEYLWRNFKKQATHLRYFATYEALIQTVEAKLTYFSRRPRLILDVMGQYRRDLELAPA